MGSNVPVRNESMSFLLAEYSRIIESVWSCCELVGLKSQASLYITWKMKRQADVCRFTLT